MRKIKMRFENKRFNINFGRILKYNLIFLDFINNETFIILFFLFFLRSLIGSLVGITYETLSKQIIGLSVTYQSRK